MKFSYSWIVLCFFVYSIDAQECKDWFSDAELKPGKDCLLECALIETDMRTFDCPSMCNVLCKSSVKEQFRENEFSAVSFAKTEDITLRTIENYLKFLKDNNLIYFEGARKTGKYQVTGKYKKLKKSIK